MLQNSFPSSFHFLSIVLSVKERERGIIKRNIHLSIVRYTKVSLSLLLEPGKYQGKKIVRKIERKSGRKKKLEENIK